MTLREEERRYRVAVSSPLCEGGLNLPEAALPHRTREVTYVEGLALYTARD